MSSNPIIADAQNVTDFNALKTRLKKRYQKIRAFTEKLAEPLEVEDYVVQAVERTSPAKWHLAHTSWFFEAFILKKGKDDYKSLHPQYDYIFNSYYVQTSDPHCRDKRGNLSRPTVKQVYEFRKYIDEQMMEFIDRLSDKELDKWSSVIEIGLNHEQQHQELLLTDLKFMFAQNPLYPIYKEKTRSGTDKLPPMEWISFNEGVYGIGHNGKGFGYDNEFPRHNTYIHPFEIANRLVTNGEFLEFMESGGYETTKWWLDEGFSAVEREEWKSPLYWIVRDGKWHHYTLNGVEPLDMNEPVTHVSYFEADAFARWRGCRLPTEQEWEVAAQDVSVDGNFVESGYYHPVSVMDDEQVLHQMFGDAWQWTQSSYAPYPGYEPFPGALGEYNGKFMVNQYVLRGGSCATSESHFRRTYRNFFHTDARWQFSGIRLVKDGVK